MTNTLEELNKRFEQTAEQISKCEYRAAETMKSEWQKEVRHRENHFKGCMGRHPAYALLKS